MKRASTHEGRPPTKTGSAIRIIDDSITWTCTGIWSEDKRATWQSEKKEVDAQRLLDICALHFKAHDGFLSYSITRIGYTMIGEIDRRSEVEMWGNERTEINSGKVRPSRH
jgi:hypothetical protein